MNERLFISRQELIRTFGFSAPLVEELGRPDFIRANRGWGCTYLYDLARAEVFAEEHAERIAGIVAARPHSQARARAVSDRRRAETVEWSWTISLCVEPIPPYALEHARRYFAPQPITRERALLYLRLHYTSYLECVRLAARRYSAAEARVILRDRIDALLNAALLIQGVILPG